MNTWHEEVLIESRNVENKEEKKLKINHFAWTKKKLVLREMKLFRSPKMSFRIGKIYKIATKFFIQTSKSMAEIHF